LSIVFVLYSIQYRHPNPGVAISPNNSGYFDLVLTVGRYTPSVKCLTKAS